LSLSEGCYGPWVTLVFASPLEERQRLARELHDSVTQLLYSLTLLAEAGRRLVGTGSLERAQESLVRLGETAG
jgi:signal transduction histidine kinase